MYQLMKSVEHMHRNGIFHRDIKPENVLLMDDELKLADFGSCRGIYSKQPYTEYISTRWYRAPECLLTDGYYNYKMDVWGVGCVWFEILALFPLFPGNNELDQVHKIHNIMGTPGPEILEQFQKQASHMDFNFPPKEGTGIDKLIPHVTPECRDIIKQLLIYDNEKRISTRQALSHPYFAELASSEEPKRNPTVDRSANNSKTPQKKDIDSRSLQLPEIPSAKPTEPSSKQPFVNKFKRKPAYMEPKVVKPNPSFKTIGAEHRMPAHSLKKVALEPKKTFVSPYSKKSFYKSYY